MLLTKDKRIRYRARELGALQGHLFCVVDGNATVAAMSERLIRALPAISRAVARGPTGFWHVHADGSLTRMWP